jgi:hypothetical protein
VLGKLMVAELMKLIKKVPAYYGGARIAQNGDTP